MTSDNPSLARAEAFLLENARLLERRIYEHRFRAGSTDAVLSALRAYRNRDGGLGQGLEPDVAAFESQPIHIEQGFRLLAWIGARDRELAMSACDFLALHAEPSGAVPSILPSALEAPAAAHWHSDFGTAPSFERAICIAGVLHAQGIEHPWLEAVTASAWKHLEAPIEEGHLLLGALRFLQYVPDRERADTLFGETGRCVFDASTVQIETPVADYCITPLEFAPSPEAPCRALFDDAGIEAHLDDLAGRQQEDGGWGIAWTPPGPGAVCAWRGLRTLEAIDTLRAYGRL